VIIFVTLVEIGVGLAEVLGSDMINVVEGFKIRLTLDSGACFFVPRNLPGD
jgi:hypothetical protein